MRFWSQLDTSFNEVLVYWSSGLLRFWSHSTFSVTIYQPPNKEDNSQTGFVFFLLPFPTWPRWWGCSHIFLFLSLIYIFRHSKNVGGRFRSSLCVCMPVVMGKGGGMHVDRICCPPSQKSLTSCVGPLVERDLLFLKKKRSEFLLKYS